MRLCGAASLLFLRTTSLRGRAPVGRAHRPLALFPPSGRGPEGTMSSPAALSLGSPRERISWLASQLIPGCSGGRVGVGRRAHRFEVGALFLPFPFPETVGTCEFS